MNLAIHVEELSLTRADKPILDGVNFACGRGDCWLVIGPNGAGKTSLLKSILGLVNPSAGKVSVAGRDLKGMPARTRARLVGYVPQSLDLTFNMEVWSFLELARFAHEDTLSMNRERLAWALEQTETGHLKDRFINELSGGERQRVLLAAALAQEPGILLLDEPAASLDPGHQIELIELLLDVHLRLNLSLVIVTHHWNAYAAFSPKVLALKTGKVFFDGTYGDMERLVDSLFECAFHKVQVGDRFWSLPGYP